MKTCVVCNCKGSDPYFSGDTCLVCLNSNELQAKQKAKAAKALAKRRERIATACLQGLISRPSDTYPTLETYENVRDAICFADKLIEWLDKQ